MTAPAADFSTPSTPPLCCLAAAAYKKWAGLKRKPAVDMKVWLMQYVNDSLPTSVGHIKQRWVTERLPEIQQRAGMVAADVDATPAPITRPSMPPELWRTIEKFSSLRPGPGLIHACAEGDEDAIAVRDGWMARFDVKHVSREDFGNFHYGWKLRFV